MSMFKVSLTAINPKEEHRYTPKVEVLVDTGAELSCMPKQILLDAGITPRGKKQFRTATAEIFEREVGFAILTAEEYITTDEVVFGEEGDLSLLGVRTIEGFNVMVDNVNHCFTAVKSVLAPTNISLNKY